MRRLTGRPASAPDAAEALERAMETAGATRFGSLRHLAARFLRSISPAGPSPQDEVWALDALHPGERELWQRMSGPDRRHAVRVAREAARLLDEPGDAGCREIIAAALLHDVGKVDCDLGTLSRVAITFEAVVLGAERFAAGPRDSVRRASARRYLEHDRVGAELLRRAGSGELTIAWAEQHHLEPEAWTIEPRIGRLLKAADGS